MARLRLSGSGIGSSHHGYAHAMVTRVTSLVDAFEPCTLYAGMLLRRIAMTPSPQESIDPSRGEASSRLGALLACGVWLASLSACTALVTTPDRPTVEKRAAGVSYQDGLTYLENARKNM